MPIICRAGPRISRLRVRNSSLGQKKGGHGLLGLCPPLVRPRFSPRLWDAGVFAYFRAFKMDCAETVARGLPSTTTAGRLLMP